MALTRRPNHHHMPAVMEGRRASRATLYCSYTAQPHSPPAPSPRQHEHVLHAALHQLVDARLQLRVLQGAGRRGGGGSALSSRSTTRQAGCTTGASGRLRPSSLASSGCKASSAAMHTAGPAAAGRAHLRQQLLPRGLHLQRPRRQLLEPRQQQAVARHACRRRQGLGQVQLLCVSGAAQTHGNCSAAKSLRAGMQQPNGHAMPAQPAQPAGTHPWLQWQRLPPPRERAALGRSGCWRHLLPSAPPPRAVPSWAGRRWRRRGAAPAGTAPLCACCGC